MSQQDVQTMREAYEAFNRQDIPAVLDRFDPQIEWIEPGGGRAPAGTYRGPQSVANDVFTTIPQNFDELRAEPEQFIDAGEYVAVVGRFRGKAKSGAALDAPFVHVWRMRNGKAARFHNYVAADPWASAWGG
ncbi:MAG: nuclear transport factor 2 family protein [Longimicrobiaceae bacterium]|jgi:ketosteroid isomerase-like protein